MLDISTFRTTYVKMLFFPQVVWFLIQDSVMRVLQRPLCLEKSFQTFFPKEYQKPMSFSRYVFSVTYVGKQVREVSTPVILIRSQLLILDCERVPIDRQWNVWVPLISGEIPHSPGQAHAYTSASHCRPAVVETVLPLHRRWLAERWSRPNTSSSWKVTSQSS